MITYLQAKETIEQNTKSISPQTLPILDCLGLIAAADIFSPIDVPSFDNSAMDGYAIRFMDYEKQLAIKLSSEIQAGLDVLPVLQEAETARIFTGAPVPKGADTVVPQEDVKIENGVLNFLKPVEKGNHIRKQGTQTQKGTLVLPKNTLLTAEYLGFLATLGIANLLVFPKPKVGIIITGKELVALGNPLPDNKIYESNSVSLKLALLQMGIQAAFSIWVDDDKNELKKIVEDQVSKVDVLIFSGGISVGDYDFVKPVLEELGTTSHFYKVKQKPGKPLYFGTLENTTIFALPGNPAAVVSCFHVYIKPFLKTMMGKAECSHKRYGILLTDYKKKPGLTHFVKAWVVQNKIEILSNQLSYQMDAFSKANALVVLREEQDFFQTGEKLEFVSLTE